MEARELALLVEFSEARAYASLMQCAPPPVLAASGVAVVRFASAIAVVADAVAKSLNMNRVIGLGVMEPADEPLVDRIVELYAARGLSFGIEIGPHAAPAAIAEWLRARRIRRGVATAMHYRALPAQPPQHPDAPPRRDDVRVTVAPSASRGAVADICCAVFRMPAAAHDLIAGTADNAAWRQWLAICNGEPVGAALSYVEDGVAWLGWDATLPGCRGRGVQAALIAARLDDAVARGCTFATSETAVDAGVGGDPSFRNYRRAGFALAYERATYVGLHGARRRGS